MITQAKFYIHHFQPLTNSANAHSDIVQKKKRTDKVSLYLILPKGKGFQTVK